MVVKWIEGILLQNIYSEIKVEGKRSVKWQQRSQTNATKLHRILVHSFTYTFECMHTERIKDDRAVKRRLVFEKKKIEVKNE